MPRRIVRAGGKVTRDGTACLGVATSGTTVACSGMGAFRFQCGRMIKSWSESAGLGLLRQLGGMK